MSEIELDCPECGGAIVIDAAGTGLTVNCNLCSKPIRVPKPEGKRSESGVKFACPRCSQHMQAPSEMLGTVVNCPSCSARLQVPFPTMMPTRPRPRENRGEGKDIATKLFAQTGEAIEDQRDPTTGERHSPGTIKAKERHGCLTAWLCLVAAIGLIFTVLPWTLDTPSDMYWRRLYISAFGIMALVSVIAVFRWRKWGVYSLATSVIGFTILCAYLANVRTQTPVGSTMWKVGSVGALIVGLLFVLLQIRRQGRKGWSQLGGSLRPLAACIVCATLLLALAPSTQFASNLLTKLRRSLTEYRNEQGRPSIPFEVDSVVLKDLSVKATTIGLKPSGWTFLAMTPAEVSGNVEFKNASGETRLFHLDAATYRCTDGKLFTSLHLYNQKAGIKGPYVLIHVLNPGEPFQFEVIEMGECGAKAGGEEDAAASAESSGWLRWPFLLRWLLPILIILVLIGTGYYYAPVLRRRIRGSTSVAGNGRCYCSLAMLQAGASWTYRSAACWARRVASRVSTVVKAGIDRHTAKVSSTWARQSITADDIRQSVSRTIRSGLTMAGLLALQGLLLISLKTNNYSFNAYDWLALIIKLIITGIGISLYKPIVLIVSSHVAAFVRSGRKPGWQPYCGNFVAVARNLTLLVLLGMCGLILVPKLGRFNAQVLHVEWVTTGLHVGVVLAAVGILFLVWLHAYPLVDLLSGAITGKVAPSPGSAMPPPDTALHRCPNCQTGNDSDALFCCSCGTSLQQPTKKPDPPVERQCPNCATPNDVESEFCFNCGKPL